MKSAGRARPAEKGLSGIRHKNETQPFATKMRQSETGRSGISRFATKFETRHSLSVLKVRGEISHQMANIGESATSVRRVDGAGGARLMSAPVEQTCRRNRYAASCLARSSLI